MKAKTAKTDGLTDLLRRRCAAVNIARAPFFEITGVPLRHFYPNHLMGFDVIAFDAWLGTPDGVSTNDFILTKYPARGAELQRLVKGVL